MTEASAAVKAGTERAVESLGVPSPGEEQAERRPAEARDSRVMPRNQDISEG
jgi:hypothetical protein